MCTKSRLVLICTCRQAHLAAGIVGLGADPSTRGTVSPMTEGWTSTSPILARNRLPGTVQRGKRSALQQGSWRIMWLFNPLGRRRCSLTSLHLYFLRCQQSGEMLLTICFGFDLCHVSLHFRPSFQHHPSIQLPLSVLILSYFTFHITSSAPSQKACFRIRFIA